jgi:hypothetical protein
MTVQWIGIVWDRDVSYDIEDVIRVLIAHVKQEKKSNLGTIRMSELSLGKGKWRSLGRVRSTNIPKMWCLRRKASTLWTITIRFLGWSMRKSKWYSESEPLRFECSVWIHCDKYFTSVRWPQTNKVICWDRSIIREFNFSTFRYELTANLYLASIKYLAYRGQ